VSFPLLTLSVLVFLAHDVRLRIYTIPLSLRPGYSKWLRISYRTVLLGFVRALSHTPLPCVEGSRSVISVGGSTYIVGLVV
jgi:hypothetical protein